MYIYIYIHIRNMYNICISTTVVYYCGGNPTWHSPKDLLETDQGGFWLMWYYIKDVYIYIYIYIYIYLSLSLTISLSLYI